MLGTSDLQNGIITSLSTPEGTIDAKVDKRPIDLLLSNYILSLNSSSETFDRTTLGAVFSRAIILCDALNDIRHRHALFRTLDALDWLLVGLAVQETQLYRAMDLVLNEEHGTQSPRAFCERRQVCGVRRAQGQRGRPAAEA